MKKILVALMFLLSACSQEAEVGIKTGSYKLLKSMFDTTTTITLSKDGKFTGMVTNIIMGQYKTTGNNISIELTGTTMMMGPEKEMIAEHNFIQALSLIRTFRMQKNNLVLILENGGELVFEPYEEPKE